MHIEAFRDFCLALPHCTESFPFDSHTLVYKVKNKMFALTDVNAIEAGINLKCDPEKAIELREKYSAVKPGWHMSKTHWNTVVIDGSIPTALLQKWIIDSYKEVIKGLPKKDRFEYL